jgi:hypothetical protein
MHSFPIVSTFCLVALLVFGHLRGIAQPALDTDGLNHLENVYWYALKSYCATLDSSTNVVYVQKEAFVGSMWPTQYQNHAIQYLYEPKEYRKAIKKQGRAAIIVGIRPLQLQNGSFSVSVIPFGVSYSRRKLRFVNGGGWIVYFEYDPVKKGLVYQSSRWSSF